MKSHLPEHAQAFQDLFRHVEHALRGSRYCQPKRKRAEVDWRAFAKELGDGFFYLVCQSQAAQTLIKKPPRVCYLHGGWQPREPAPITSVVDLFERGVCQVRANIAHGLKYIDPEGPRGDALVKEAHWVLEQAMLRHPEAKKIFGALLADISQS